MAKLFVMFALLVLISATTLTSSVESKLHQTKLKSHVHSNHLVKRIVRQAPWLPEEVCCKGPDGVECCYNPDSAFKCGCA
ncbi:hypothetical protein DdX_15579 [Ditylenchus destructor]|uniref:Uncharacterized protein n=1 Tax=Ditylenchus destructor TaxID=166010 RepID=A0AAD4MQ10_9BILA|nr:hypothetical protein DdX_15579 [Ditylenchus destructor]